MNPHIAIGTGPQLPVRDYGASSAAWQRPISTLPITAKIAIPDVAGQESFPDWVAIGPDAAMNTCESEAARQLHRRPRAESGRAERLAARDRSRPVESKRRAVRSA